MPAVVCPCCRAKLDAASNLPGESAAPEPGDFSLCFGCGAVLTFDDALALHLADRAVVEAALAEDPAFAHALAALGLEVAQRRPVSRASPITCPRCGRTSFNLRDVAEGYCGHCHDVVTLSS